jgi:outer membrane protein, heavy metal efflux system
MKYTKIYKIVILLIVLSGTKEVFAQQQTGTLDTLSVGTSLDEYLKISAENNPYLKSLFNQYMAALERLPQAKALPDPSVMFSIFTSPVETRVGATRAGVAISQAFPWFGQLSAQENAAAQSAKSSFELLNDERNRLFYKVRSTYYELYVLEAAIRITNENIDLLKSFKGLANVRLEAGTGSAVDLLRVEMDLAELENELKYLDDTRRPIYAEFIELLNFDIGPTIEIPDTLLTIDFEDTKSVLLDSIRDRNPSLKKLEFEIGALTSEIDVARKMGLPSFDIGLAYTYVDKRSDVADFSGNGKDQFIFPQIGVRIPLYRKKYTSMVSEKEYLKTAVAQQKENRLNELVTELEKGWRDYLDAQRRVALYKYLIELADQSLDILLAEFTSAGKDFEEVLRMDRQLLNYELELEKARAEQNTAVAFITYLTGKNLLNN